MAAAAIFNLFESKIAPQTDRQTDRQTTCDRNTALCTKVHRAVKIPETLGAEKEQSSL